MSQGYSKYLRSEHWRELRALKVAEAPRCERCGSGLDLEVHHKEYREGWRNTRLSDLETLCHGCHGRHHAVAGQLPVGMKLRAMEERQRPEQEVKRWSKRPLTGRPKIEETMREMERQEKERRSKRVV